MVFVRARLGDRAIHEHKERHRAGTGERPPRRPQAASPAHDSSDAQVEVDTGLSGSGVGSSVQYRDAHAPIAPKPGFGGNMGGNYGSSALSIRLAGAARIPAANRPPVSLPVLLCRTILEQLGTGGDRSSSKCTSATPTPGLSGC